jgi:hypothetical protein
MCRIASPEVGRMTTSTMPGIGVPDDPRMERRERILERAGWLVIAAILAAALAGFFASGPVADGSAEGSGGRLQLDFQRYARNGGMTDLRVRAEPADSAADSAEIWFGNDYLNAIQIEGVVPEPEAWVAGRDGVVLRFEAVPGEPVQATVIVRPDEFGRQHGAIALGEDPPIRFWQFFYP